MHAYCHLYGHLVLQRSPDGAPLSFDEITSYMESVSDMIVDTEPVSDMQGPKDSHASSVIPPRTAQGCSAQS